MLEGADGPQVMEVNSSPGLEGIERATGFDIAGAIIDYVEQHVRFPEMDVRQRLFGSPGYGVAELPVSDDSVLVGKSLNDSQLRDRDIVVLTIHRATEEIPNPKGTRVLKAGDRLLCFGKLAAMKELVPQPAQRRPQRRKPAPDAS